MSEDTELDDEEPTVKITLDAPDQLAYDALRDRFGEELIEGDLSEVVKQRVRSLYDSQDEIEQRLTQANQPGQLR